MSEAIIKPGQRWRRKRDGVVVSIMSQAGDPIHDDWNVRDEEAKRSRRVFGWNIHRLYEPVPAITESAWRRWM